jgi:hypothetical protein
MSWMREHLQGQYTARVTLENGRYRASVDELSYSVHVPSLEEAQKRADALLANDEEHDCGPDACGTWRPV